MKRIARRVFWSVAAAAVVATVIYGFWPKPIEVDLATVDRGPLQVTVDEDGKTRIKERYVISTPLAGKLRRIELHAGDPVEAGKAAVALIEPGDPALLDPRARAEAEARVRATDAARQQAEAKLGQAQQSHALAKHEIDRVRPLAARGIASQEEFDAAEHKEQITREELRAAEFGVRVAMFENELAQAALIYTRVEQNGKPNGAAATPLAVKSPVTGRVLRVLRESAGVVAAGAPLVEVGDPTDLELEIDVLSADAVRVKPGAKVILEHWGGDAPLVGRVRIVEPAGFLKVSALGVEEQRVNVIADLQAPPQERPTLGDAYRVEARIVIWEGDDVLKVPSGALFRQGDDWAAFVEQDGRAEIRPVRIGWNNGLEAEVLEGLTAGDRVVLHPSDRIANGTRVSSRWWEGVE